MYGIVSLLDSKHEESVRELWSALEASHALRPARETLVPHLSLHVAEGYDLKALQSPLEGLARTTQPFKIHTAGIGVFTAEQPVVYLPVVRDPLLSTLHQAIWQLATSLSEDVHHYFHPQRWIPHITLADLVGSPSRMGDVVELLAKHDLAWEIHIDNLAVLCDDCGKHEVRTRFALTG
jgi:2'-5' RNA ligase